ARHSLLKRQCQQGLRRGFSLTRHFCATYVVSAAAVSTSWGPCMVSSVCHRLLLLLALCLAGPLVAAEPERYNIISIVTDDQARWGVGLYGNREVKTPNMDRIGREGACFLNAFVTTPVCSPSRAAFLSGRYGTQLGITDWIAPVESD